MGAVMIVIMAVMDNILIWMIGTECAGGVVVASTIGVIGH